MTKCRCAHGLSWFRTCPACVDERTVADALGLSWDSDQAAPIERRVRERRTTFDRRYGTGKNRRQNDNAEFKDSYMETARTRHFHFMSQVLNWRLR